MRAVILVAISLASRPVNVPVPERVDAALAVGGSSIIRARTERGSRTQPSRSPPVPLAPSPRGNRSPGRFPRAEPRRAGPESRADRNRRVASASPSRFRRCPAAGLPRPPGRRGSRSRAGVGVSMRVPRPALLQKRPPRRRPGRSECARHRARPPAARPRTPESSSRSRKRPAAHPNARRA